MYKRILLAYDGSVEGRAALREGALLAGSVGAQVYLLSVIADTAGMKMAESAHAGAVAHEFDAYRDVLDGGVRRLKELGFDTVAKLVVGQPAEEIGDYAKEIGADLVVVSHRKQNFLTRWWSGSVGANLLDRLDCTLLVARNIISDDEFAAEMATARLG